MLTQDDIEEIQRLKKRRYSQDKVAKKLNIGRSTVANYWHGEKKKPKKALYETGTGKLNLNVLFVLGKCGNCGTTYPMPRFLPSWICPNCKKPKVWNKS